MIAALYVEKGGAYFGLPDVDPWDEERDARNYDGPYPVVAHPPCARWSVLAGMVETRYGYPRGDDDGCFEAAVSAVRAFGGVLEHPAYSAAWPAFDMPEPMRGGGWVGSLTDPGWSCCVDQGWYGHPLRKPTWLYAVGTDLPRLPWGRGPGANMPDRDNSVSEQDRKRLALPTPPAFRDVLLSMARSVEHEGSSFADGTSAYDPEGIAADEGTRCEVCDLPAGHPGPHEKTFLLCEASPGWTGSPEQWAAFRANPPRITIGSDAAA